MLGRVRMTEIDVRVGTETGRGWRVCQNLPHVFGGVGELSPKAGDGPQEFGMKAEESLTS